MIGAMKKRRKSSAAEKRSSLIEYMMRKFSTSKNTGGYWYVDNPIEYFTGRSEFLEELHDCVTRQAEKDVRGNRITIILGVSGIGKSEVAMKYASLYGPWFDDNVIWIKADSFEAITNSFMAAAKVLNIPTADHRYTREVHDKVYDFFSFQSLHSLFIFDNVENFKYAVGTKENGVDYFFPANPREHRQYYPHFLLTSSHNMRDTVGMKNIRVLTLEPFTELESLLTMGKIMNVQDAKKQTSLQTCKDAQNLHFNLYGYPFAILLATSYIRSQDQFSTLLHSPFPKAFLEGFETFNKILRPDSDTSMPNPSANDHLNTVWKIILSQIEQKPLGNLCYEALQLMSLLDPDSITVGLIFVVKHDIRSIGQTTKTNSPKFQELEQALQILNDYSLITFPIEKSPMEKYVDENRQLMWRSDGSVVRFTEGNLETILKYRPLRIHRIVQKLVRQTFSNVVPRVLPTIVESLLEVPKRLQIFLGRSIFTIHAVLIQLPDTVSTLQALENLGWKFRLDLDTTKILEDVYEIAKRIKKVISDDDLFLAWLFSLYARVASFGATNERSRISIQSTIFNIEPSVTVAELIKFVIKYLKIFLQNPENWRMVSVTFAFFTVLTRHWQFDRISLGLLVQMAVMGMECLNDSDANKFEDDHPIFYFFLRVSEVILLPTTVRVQMLKGILNFMKIRPVTPNFQPHLWTILKNITKGEVVLHNFYERGGFEVFFQYWKQPKANVVQNWNDTWASFGSLDTVIKVLSLNESSLMSKILDTVDTTQQPSFLSRMRKIPHQQNSPIIHLACSLVFMYLVKNRPDKETFYSYLLFEDLRFVLSKEFVNAMMSILKTYYQQRFQLPGDAEFSKAQFNKIQKMVLKMQTSFTKFYNSGGLEPKDYASIRQELDDIYHEVNECIEKDKRNSVAMSVSTAS